jgi:VanZ family protein
VLLLSVTWALVIFILCATPGAYIPNISFLEMLSFDKWVHASMFFILNSLLFLVAIKYRKSITTALFYFVICILYGLLLEFMQARIFSDRSADWLDVIANTFGCLVAAIFYKKLKTLGDACAGITSV